jgi:hypothetical protein
MIKHGMERVDFRFLKSNERARRKEDSVSPSFMI